MTLVVTWWRCLLDLTSPPPLPLLQESAQHRIADFHARDAAAVWLILACQSVAVWPDEALLAEVCHLPSSLVASGLELDEAIVRAALTCVMHDPSAAQDRLLSIVEGVSRTSLCLSPLTVLAALLMSSLTPYLGTPFTSLLTSLPLLYSPVPRYSRCRPQPQCADLRHAVQRRGTRHRPSIRVLPNAQLPYAAEAPLALGRRGHASPA